MPGPSAQRCAGGQRRDRAGADGPDHLAVVDAAQVDGGEIDNVGADFGHLEPMLDAAQHELQAAGVDEVPEVLLADAGYWHSEQMANVVNRGIPILIPTDTSRRRTTRCNWEGGHYAFMRRVLATEHGGALYRKRQPMIEPVFAQVKFNRGLGRSDAAAAARSAPNGA